MGRSLRYARDDIVETICRCCCEMGGAELYAMKAGPRDTAFLSIRYINNLSRLDGFRVFYAVKTEDEFSFFLYIRAIREMVSPFLTRCSITPVIWLRYSSFSFPLIFFIASSGRRRR